MHPAEGDHVCVGLGSLARESERVTDEVSDILDLGDLVVVGEDHGIPLLCQSADLGVEVALGVWRYRRRVLAERGRHR